LTSIWIISQPVNKRKNATNIINPTPSFRQFYKHLVVQNQPGSRFGSKSKEKIEVSAKASKQ
jgi:hypothetical protein